MLKPLFLLILLASPLPAAITSKPLDYKHNDTPLQGILFFDDQVKEKRPAILVVHEWWGLNDYAQQRARQLAEMGYVAFAVDMYGVGVRAANVNEAMKLSSAVKDDRPLMRARMNAALDLVKKQPQADPARTAAIGYCFGGTCALELARSGADLSGVVSFHGALATSMNAKPNSIKSKILVAHGGSDPFVGDPELLFFHQEMKNAQADYQIILYGHALHTFTNPAASNANLPGVAYDPKADHRSWQAMQAFFKELFDRTK